MFHSCMLSFASLTQCQLKLSSSAARGKYALVLQSWDERGTFSERSYRSQPFMYNMQLVCVCVCPNEKAFLQPSGVYQNC